MRSITGAALRTIASVVAACAVLTLVVVGVEAANASTSTPTAATIADNPTDDPVGSPTASTVATDSGRAQLRADLRAARQLSGAERKAALDAIWKDAKAGEYGAAVQRRVERRADRRQFVFALLPADLQSDLKALRALPADQRAAQRKQIIDDAAAGKYGDQVAAAVKKWRELHGR